MRITLMIDTDNDAFYDSDGEQAPQWQLGAIVREFVPLKDVLGVIRRDARGANG